MRRSPEEERIYRALSRVETPEFDLASALEGRRAEPNRNVRPRRMLRTALAAACLLLALAAGAAALVGISGAWQYFFGGNPIPTAAISVIDISQTSGEYTLTLEDTVADNNGLLILFSLRRADGGDVDPDAALEAGSKWTRLLVDGKSFGGGGGVQGRQVSEDGKTLYLCYEVRNESIRGEESPLGRPLTFQADCVAKRIYHMGEGIPTSLAPLAELEIPEVPFSGVHDADYNAALNAALASQEIALPLPLDERFPSFRIRGAVVTKDGLAVAIENENALSKDLLCSGVWAEELTDTRDGTVYSIYEGNGVELADGTHAMLWSFRDCTLTREDLPYLELTVSYDMDQILSDKPFSLTFTADSGTAVTIPLDETVTVTGLTLSVTELRLSALDFTLRFADTGAFDLYETKGAPSLKLTDGSVLHSKWAGGYGQGDGTCAVSFNVEDERGERVFFDTGAIESVTFGDLTIPLA